MKRTSNSKIKKILRSRLGMTYVELLTALGLLALIITAFTPMLLSSYETLYDAGVKVQDVYDSKQEIEEGLARRDSESAAAVKLNMRVNADALFEQVNVSGRKIISTFREGLETVFGQIRARIEIVSPSTVYDNATNHTIILQTFGMEYSKITFGAFNYDTTNEPGAANKMPADQIHIQVIAPNKAAKKSGGTADENMIGTEDELVYSSGRFCEVEYYSSKFNTKPVTAAGLEISNDTDAGRIKLKIKSPASGDKIDFTYSPLKVKVYYINNRGNLATVSDYLYIEPATLLMAGETTSTIDYYTSAGIEAVDVSESDDPDDKAIEYQLKAEARKMRVSNSAYLNNTGRYLSTAIGSPGDNKAEIHSIRWIDNDETQGLNPYYVMTGTNGSIYRMYSFSSDKSDMFSYATGAKIYDESTGFFNTAQDYIDRVYTTDTGKRVYPALWGGDFSHIFEYTSAQRRTAYGTSINNYPGASSFLNTNSDNDQTWVTSGSAEITWEGKQYTIERAGISGDPKYNIMSPVAQFCYYYNGDGSKFDFPTKNMRNISYILTERGKPLRLFGVLKSGGILNGKSDDFREFYDIWDKVNVIPGQTATQYSINDVSNTTHTWLNQVYCFYYKDDDSTSQNDYTLSAIRIKSLASYDLSLATDSAVNYLDNDEDNNYTTSMVKLPNTAGKDVLGGQSYDVDVTDAIYIPGTDNTQGSTFYVGSVNAFCNVVQTNRVSEAQASKNEKWVDDGYYKNYQNFWGSNHNCYSRGVTTDFLIFTDDDGEHTYIAKYDDSESNVGTNTNGYNRDGYSVRQSILNSATSKVRTTCQNIENGIPEDYGFIDGSNKSKRAEFFFPDLSATWKYIYLKDTRFTFGFSSNREKVYTNITYDGETELVRSFERLYWRSHYGQDAYTGSAQDAFYGSELTLHLQNRMTAHTDGKIVADAAHGYQYLNSAENDYYNVWFPGEMYNLNKVASKDGVTVAVGYSVVGSAYQYINSGAASRTSTALGGIYNDGVLSAMIEGKDDAFVNLLYFKDNSSFDGTSYSGKTFYTSGDSTYGNYPSYGTHARDSVQFTAVDLVVENVKASETATNYTVNYYAYYGDSKGRVYRSLIATGAGNSGNEGESTAEDMNVELVPFIKDTTFNNQTGATTYSVGGRTISYSGMEAITVDGAGLDSIFSRIVTIDAKDDMVIITGEMKNGGYEYLVVGVYEEDDSGNFGWVWRKVLNCGFTSIINDATIAGGYYYIVGDGWLAGVSLDVLRDTSVTTLSTPSLTSAARGCYSDNPNDLLWCSTSVKLYAIAGRDTQ